MKKNIFAFMLCAYCAINFQASAFGKQNIPTSKRLASVRKRVIPNLEKALKNKGLTLGSPVFMRIFKQAAELSFFRRIFRQTGELEVWVQSGQTFKLFKTYPICYFSGGLGPKLKQGDGQSPEGFYYVKPSQMNPTSQFHLSFNLGFPNTYDRSHGRTGSHLMVHGNCVSIGCYAMTDKGIEEIYVLANEALRHGQPFFRVHIFPFRMTEANMRKHKVSKWIAFWRNLKEGYDFFEKHKIPPNVEVKNKRYVLSVSGGDLKTSSW